MTSDARAQQARQMHRRSMELTDQAARARDERDRLVRTLRSEDPKSWTYPALARAVGCSDELIALIIKGPERKARGLHR